MLKYVLQKLLRLTPWLMSCLYYKKFFLREIINKAECLYCIDELKISHGNYIRILNELIDINPVFSPHNIINKVLVREIIDKAE